MADPGRLIIICGLPGSGKTTLSHFLAKRLGAFRYESDAWVEALGLERTDWKRRKAIEDLQWQSAEIVLRSGGIAIIEWGTWWRNERDILRRRCREMGASVELIYLDVPFLELTERIRKRGRPDPRPELLERWSKQFQPPDAEELALFDPPLIADLPVAHPPTHELSDDR